ncbi:hypothetical protein NHJ13734_009869 [Beauveria thailandica]
MSRTLLVAVMASAALQSVGAQPLGNFTTGDYIGRIEGNVHKVGDSCHPLGTYRLGDSSLIVPPCIAEQAITSWCEKATGVGGDQTPDMMKAYRDCLFGQGSTLLSDQSGCLDCKVANKFLTEEQANFFRGGFEKGNDAFKNTPSAPSPLWNTVQKYLDWAAYDKLPKLHDSARNNTKVPVEEYFKNAVTPQSFGQYALDGNDDQCPTDALPPVLQDPIENRDPLGQEIEAIVPGANNAAEFSTVTLYQAQVNFFQFTSGGGFTFGCIKEELVRLSNVRVKPASKDEIKSLPNAVNCTSCQQKSVTRQSIDKAAASPATPASDQGQFVLSMIASIIDQSGQITAAAQQKIDNAVAEKFEETPSAIADVEVNLAGTAEKTPSDSQRKGSDRCIRKRIVA